MANLRPEPDLLQSTDESLRTFYKLVRSHTEEVCAPLKKEDYVAQPVVDVSPPKWHLAHTTWFFETFVLIPNNPSYKVFSDDYGYLFNSYYNHVGERVQRHHRGRLTRPTIDDVMAYRAYVDAAISELLSSEEKAAVVEEVLTLGLHHEMQHQELLLTDIKYILGSNPIYPVYDSNCQLDNIKNESDPGWVSIEEGVYEIGFSGDGFHFDNELGIHRQYIHRAQISKNLVTWGEYLEFIEDGGYDNFEYWLDEGWAWRKEHDIQSPLYALKKNGMWGRYTLAGWKEIDPNSVLIHVSYYEAEAYANWKGLRLPSEFEWEVASEHFDWGFVWEWTQSAYSAYPGFKKAKGALGEYNGKFMVNQMVLRGSSMATSKGHSRKSYRNFFHPHLQWQFAGIRLAK